MTKSLMYMYYYNLVGDIGRKFNFLITLRMSGLMALGPLEENETFGAITFFQASVKNMVAVGLL